MYCPCISSGFWFEWSPRVIYSGSSLLFLWTWILSILYLLLYFLSFSKRIVSISLLPWLSGIPSILFFQLYLFFMYLMWIDCSVDSICIVVSSDMSSGYISSVFRFEWFYLQYILSQCLFLCFLSAFHLYYSSTFCILSEYFWRLSTKCFNLIIDAFCMLPLEVYWKI